MTERREMVAGEQRGQFRSCILRQELQRGGGREEALSGRWELVDGLLVAQYSGPT